MDKGERMLVKFLILLMIVTPAWGLAVSMVYRWPDHGGYAGEGWALVMVIIYALVALVQADDIK